VVLFVRFLTMFSQIAGRDATDLVKEMRVDQLPVLIVIAKVYPRFFSIVIILCSCILCYYIVP